MNDRNNFEKIIEYGQVALLGDKDNYYIKGPEAENVFSKGEVDMATVLPFFIKEAFSKEEYSKIGEAMFKNMSYFSQFKAILFEERKDYELLPEMYVENLYNEFLEEDSFTGFIPAETLELIIERAGVDQYFESASPEKQRVFVDMDGTLAKWSHVGFQELFEEGYFYNLEPHQNFVDNIRALQKEPTKEVYILSAVLMESPFALAEKNLWLNRYLPEIDAEHRVFVPCTDKLDKTEFIPGGLKKGDVLIDDYTKNLEQWRKAGGIGIKAMTEMNNTKGSWVNSGGSYIDINCSLEELTTNLDMIKDITQGREIHRF